MISAKSSITLRVVIDQDKNEVDKIDKDLAMLLTSEEEPNSKQADERFDEDESE